MLPILLSLGPVKIYSYGLFLFIGLFVALYFWWKMGRDEHFDEILLFDAFFLSLMTFFVTGRIGYVLMHMDKVGTLYRSLAVLSFPGIDSVIGLFCALIFIVLFAKSNDYDPWKVTDAYVVALAFALIFGGIAGLLNGSNPGIPASWGVMYPGQTQNVIPVDLFTLLWAMVTFGVVSRVRKNFRFYAWYKGEASVAQEGLASLVFGIAAGIYLIVSALISRNSYFTILRVVPLELVLGVVLGGVCIYLIEKRVGRRDHTLWGKLKGLVRRK